MKNSRAQRTKFIALELEWRGVPRRLGCFLRS